MKVGHERAAVTISVAWLSRSEGPVASSEPGAWDVPSVTWVEEEQNKCQSHTVDLLLFPSYGLFASLLRMVVCT